MPDPAPIPAPDLVSTLARIADALAAQGGIVPEGLSPAEAARFIGVSPSKLHELNSRGLMPAPAELGDGKCPRFSRSILSAWLKAGAPSRIQWLAMKDSVMRKTG